MTNDIKIFLAIIGGTLLVVFGAAFLLGQGNKPSSTTTNSTGQSVVTKNILIKSDAWAIGSPSAKVTLVEFADFECPACKASEPELKNLLAKYADNLYFVFRHFPLPSHTYAMDAAVAAEAAGKQGKFWEMRDKLFDNQPNFRRDQLVSFAKDLGLDTTKFSADLDSSALRQKVLDDQADGNRAGIDATPTFFVNSVKYVGIADVDSAIASQLK